MQQKRHGNCKTYAKELRDYLRKTEMTVYRMAQILNIEQSTIHRWVNEENKISPMAVSLLEMHGFLKKNKNETTRKRRGASRIRKGRI